MKAVALGLLLSCVVGFAHDSIAAPLPRADLPSNPDWVIHLDFDALRQSYLGKYLLYHLDKPELKSNMIAFQSLFGFDLRTQLHSMTLYGEGPASKDGVVIIYADMVQDRLITLVRAGEQATSSTNAGHVIYGWIDHGNNPANPGVRKFVSVQSNRFIISARKDNVIRALAVLDGKTPNLALGNGLPELKPAGPAPFLQVAANKVDFLDTYPDAVLLKMASGFHFNASESNDQLNARLTLKAADKTSARQMEIATRGFLALLAMQKDNPKAVSLANAVNVKLNGSEVIAGLVAPSADLVGALQIVNARKSKN